MTANLVPLPTAGQRYSREQRELVKRTLMPKGASDDELSLFLGTAYRMGLDPFAQQIRAIRRKEYNADTKQYEEKISIEPGIDGFRLVGHRTGEVEAQLGPYWCGPDGVWKDAWLSEDPPAAAKFGVLRRGYREPRWAVALWREYRQLKRDGSTTRMWTDRPAGQLAKCAEALAWRATFPHELAGVYTTDEMAQADRDEVQAVISRFAVVEGGIPSAETIRQLESVAAAKELVTRELVSDRYRQEVKATEVDLFGEEWESFWRHANLDHWREVLEAARQRVSPNQITEGSGAVEQPGMVGGGEPPDAPAPANTSEGRAARTVDTPGQRGRPSGSPSDPTSPPQGNHGEATAARTGPAAGIQHSGGEVSSPASPPAQDASAPVERDTGVMTGRPADVEDQRAGVATAADAGETTGQAGSSTREGTAAAPADTGDVGPVTAWCLERDLSPGTVRAFLARHHPAEFGRQGRWPVGNVSELDALRGPGADRARELAAKQFPKAGEPKGWGGS